MLAGVEITLYAKSANGIRLGRLAIVRDGALILAHLVVEILRSNTDDRRWWESRKTS